MKFTHSLNKFLDEHVNLNKARVKRANEGFDTITSFLENAEATSELFIDTSQEGSLRQGTIIKPRKGATEFDVDVLLRVTPVEDWEAVQYLVPRP